MTRPPTERELDRLLAELPREAAPSDFSRRVLDDLDAPRRAAPGRAWPLLTVAAAALVAGILLLPRGEPPPGVAQVDDLEEQHRLLMAELEELKTSLRHGRAAAPVLYLGGNENLDLVLDLGPIWRSEAVGGARPAVQGDGERDAAARLLEADRRQRGERR